MQQCCIKHILMQGVEKIFFIKFVIVIWNIYLRAFNVLIF
jgi:hypothetical protein